MFWLFIILFIAVIGAKYYTALGRRNLERRLNRVKYETGAHADPNDIAAAVMRF